ncbi:hypothetical protein NSMS1_22410 [Nostoc sp. MS1]|nr:hypothetical protein NSMS1_22410 [Nostoc sp. MS1]
MINIGNLILYLCCLLLIIACNSFISDTQSDIKSLKVATDPTFIPLEFQTSQGERVGFDIDLMRDYFIYKVNL